MIINYKIKMISTIIVKINQRVIIKILMINNKINLNRKIINKNMESKIFKNIYKNKKIFYKKLIEKMVIIQVMTLYNKKFKKLILMQIII